jgi:hypothetical protein
VALNYMTCVAYLTKAGMLRHLMPFHRFNGNPRSGRRQVIDFKEITRGTREPSGDWTAKSLYPSHSKALIGFFS